MLWIDILGALDYSDMRLVEAEPGMLKIFSRDKLVHQDDSPAPHKPPESENSETVSI